MPPWILRMRLSYRFRRAAFIALSIPRPGPPRKGRRAALAVFRRGHLPVRVPDEADPDRTLFPYGFGLRDFG